ncbi:hypothetical protein EDD15DRAFT_2197607 [Pisolithus albus]|nr:hypothetical protein EDD15DRAFT_2197607 [Pisolithus albus]
MWVAVWVVASGRSTGSRGGSRGNQGCAACLNTSTNAGCQGRESKCWSGVDSNVGMNASHRDRESEREVRGCAAYSSTTVDTYDCGLVNPRSTGEMASAGGHGHESESEKEVDRERLSQLSRRSLRFARIWPFRPQKKQNEPLEGLEMLEGVT